MIEVAKVVNNLLDMLNFPNDLRQLLETYKERGIVVYANGGINSASRNPELLNEISLVEQSTGIKVLAVLNEGRTNRFFVVDTFQLNGGVSVRVCKENNLPYLRWGMLVTDLERQMEFQWVSINMTDISTYVTLKV